MRKRRVEARIDEKVSTVKRVKASVVERPAVRGVASSEGVTDRHFEKHRGNSKHGQIR